MRKPSVTILAFGFNERRCMEVTLPGVRQEWAEQRLFVDGGSSDGSAEYASSLGWEVLIQTQPGLRHAYREAFALCKSEWVVIFSPDGNTPSEDIPRLLAKLSEGYDLVIGSRYLYSRKSDDDTLASAAANWIFTSLINLLFARRAADGSRHILTDAMTNYRAFRTRLYYELDLDDPAYFAPYESCVALEQGRLSIEPLFSARALKARCKIAEISTEEPPRHFGAPRFPKVRGGLGYLLQLIGEWTRTPRSVRSSSQRNPHD